eukprot:TRINITY_DN6148_c0_g2_i3.p1 TRINITY_DN6148_c0_g2~~TRINITY_DN6148_c0_g2_i3.p1  ORF type:complete len:373 (-),score=61.85 TRINITY_DN6148_c0_g2_i3:424-1542(-)
MAAKLRVPGYVLEKKLGSGLHAKVYRAKLLRTSGGDVNDDNDEVAVKIFRGRDCAALLQRELRFLTAVQGHHNIVHLVESITDTPRLKALVLELCGKDLCTLTAERVFSEAEAADFMPDALSALRHVHNLRIVHRDVKPDNIALGRDGTARLMDFGISAWTFDDLEMLRKCGSPGYMAPEIIDQKSYGPPVDIFAFGATMYFILSNQHAFSTECGTVESMLAKTKFCVVSFGTNFHHVSDDSRKLISWCMHEDAKWRPDASFAVSCPPFVPDTSDEGEHRSMSFEEQLVAMGAVEVHPSSLDLPREGMKRPTPCLRRGDGARTDKSASQEVREDELVLSSRGTTCDTFKELSFLGDFAHDACGSTSNFEQKR